MFNVINTIRSFIFNNKVVKNFSYLTISSVLSQLVSIVTIIKISKVFVPEQYGVYTFVFAQAQLITIIGDLGLRYIVIRKISRDYLTVRDVVINGLKLRLLAVFVIMIFYLIYNYLYGSVSNENLLIIFLFSIVSCFSNLFENVFFGRQNMLLPSIVNLIFNIGWALIVFVIPYNQLNLQLIIWSQFIWGVIKTVIVYYFIKRANYLVGESKPFLKSSRGLLNESWPYFVQVIIILPILYLSNNFLDLNSTKEEIGYFNLSQKLTGPINMVISFALSALFPNISVMWTNDQPRFKRMISNGFKFVILPSAFACFAVTIYSKEIVLLLFNEKYIAAVEVCQLQLWYVLLMGVNSFIGTVWGAADMQKLIFKTSIINSIIATPLLFLGSYYGALGLSYAYLVSFIVFEIFLWIIFIKSLSIKVDKALLCWIITILLFISSYFLANKISNYTKLFLVLGMSLLFVFVLQNSIKKYLNAQKI